MTSRLSHLEAAGRRLAQHLADECVVTRPGTGSIITDDFPPYDTHHGPDAVIYSGPCTVSGALHTSASSTYLGQDTQVHSHHGRLPHDSPRVHVGDRLEVTASDLDPHLVGLVFDVVDARTATYKVSQRIGLRIEDRTRASR